MLLNTSFSRAALALLIGASAAACGDDAPAGTGVECGAGTTEVNGECVAMTTTCGTGTMLSNGMCTPNTDICGAGSTLTNGVCVPTAPVTTYRQIEFLGRPAIAEALIITPALLAGYNATAPSFTAAPAGAVAAITAEVQTVLRALFHGVCLLNGVAGFTAANGAKPAGVECGAVGPAVFSDVGGTMIATAQATQATAYATKVFGQFIPDTLRIDTAVATSTYLTPCNATLASGMPLLCGGRKLNDDVIDMTYYYLISGATTPLGLSALNAGQVISLVTDGVFFSDTPSENTTLGIANPDPSNRPDPTNRHQFEQSCDNCEPTVVISSTFPYSAPPH